jgi:hypothetical protein
LLRIIHVTSLQGGQQSHYGDQRDFVGRENDGHYTEGLRHREFGEQSRGREGGAPGRTGNPRLRDDVTTINTREPRK